MAWTETLTDAVTGEVAQAAWGDAVNANFAAVGPHLIAEKSADEPIASSTTLQNDDHLIVPVTANQRWQLIYNVFYTGNNGDIKIAFTFPTGGTIGLTCAARDSTSTFTIGEWLTGTSPTGAQSFIDQNNTAIITPLLIHGFYINGANAGNLTLQWAQQTSNVTATTLKQGSRVYGGLVA